VFGSRQAACARTWAGDPGSYSHHVTGPGPDWRKCDLLPACQLYLRSTDSGQRLRLERGVCIGVTETVLRLHRRLRAAYDFCPPKQVTLETAVRTVVEFTRSRTDLDRPLYELAIEAFQRRWPC